MDIMAVHHFFPSIRAWCWDHRTWSMRRQGIVVRSWTEYILGSDRQIFQNVAIWDPRHNSDHSMFVGSLRGNFSREHSHYLGSRTRLPLCPPGRQMRTRLDELFAEFRCAVPKLDKHLARHNLWISAKTWRLVDKRVSTRRDPGRD